ncbi:MAG: hypothetical protein AAFQ17_00205, partial [Pseudomonadota bacterium]
MRQRADQGERSRADVITLRCISSRSSGWTMRQIAEGSSPISAAVIFQDTLLPDGSDRIEHISKGCVRIWEM